ncbi:MAG: LamG domain-containing protein, partial [Planctomycetota bacterium]
MCKKLIYLFCFVLVLELVLTRAADAADSSLVGWWKYDEGSGTIAKDSSGNGNDGTIYNGAQTTAGQIGKALLFDEVNDHVVVPDFAYGPEFTVAFWFKSSGNAGTVFQYMFSQAPFDTSNSLNIYIGEIDQTGGYAGMIRTVLRDADDVVVTGALDLDAGLADGNWHHYGLTVSAAEGATVYINGILQLSEPSRGGDTYDPTSDLYLGGRVDLSAERFFGGALDDVRIYSRALTQEQIQQTMKGPPGTRTRLIRKQMYHEMWSLAGRREISPRQSMGTKSTLARTLATSTTALAASLRMLAAMLLDALLSAQLTTGASMRSMPRRTLWCTRAVSGVSRPSYLLIPSRT